MSIKATTSALVGASVLLSQLTAGQYTATYTPGNAPHISEQGQTGYNDCGTGSSQTSMCQNAYVNSVEDFCLWAPPSTTSDYGNSAIGNTERIEVAWCTNSGYGTRVIPQGAITGAHFVRTPHYVQITGAGDLTKLNIPAGDDGGELDPHGADGLGNPIGGLVFSTVGSSDGSPQQMHEWTNFMSSGNFCFRACFDGPEAATYCQHIYDTLGCGWNMPGDYDSGYTSCDGDDTEPMGVYGGSTFYQGDASTPPAHQPGASSQCQTVSTVGGANAVAITAGGASSNASSTASGSGSMTMSMNATASATASSSGASSLGATAAARSSGASSSSSGMATSSRSGSSAAAAASSSAPASAGFAAVRLPSGVLAWVAVAAGLVGGVAAPI